MKKYYEKNERNGFAHFCGNPFLGIPWKDYNENLLTVQRERAGWICTFQWRSIPVHFDEEIQRKISGMDLHSSVEIHS